MPRKPRQPSARTIAVAAVVEIQKLRGEVTRIRKRLRALEREDAAAEVIGFRMPQDTDDPDIEEMP